MLGACTNTGYNSFSACIPELREPISIHHDIVRLNHTIFESLLDFVRLSLHALDWGLILVVADRKDLVQTSLKPARLVGLVD